MIALTTTRWGLLKQPDKQKLANILGAGMQFLIVTHDTVAEEILRRIAAVMTARVECRGDAKSGFAARQQHASTWW